MVEKRNKYVPKSFVKFSMNYCRKNLICFFIFFNINNFNKTITCYKTCFKFLNLKTCNFIWLWLFILFFHFVTLDVPLPPLHACTVYLFSLCSSQIKLLYGSDSLHNSVHHILYYFYILLSIKFLKSRPASNQYVLLNYSI